MRLYRIIKTLSISVAISVLLNVIYLCALNLATGNTISVDFNYYHEGIIELIMMSLAVIGIFIYLYIESKPVKAQILDLSTTVMLKKAK